MLFSTGHLERTWNVAWSPTGTLLASCSADKTISLTFYQLQRNTLICLRLRDTRARAVRNVLGNVYLSSLIKNLWYEQREQLDSGGGGTLSQGAGHDGSFYRYAV